MPYRIKTNKLCAIVCKTLFGKLSRKHIAMELAKICICYRLIIMRIKSTIENNSMCYWCSVTYKTFFSHCLYPTYSTHQAVRILSNTFRRMISSLLIPFCTCIIDINTLKACTLHYGFCIQHYVHYKFHNACVSCINSYSMPITCFHSSIPNVRQILNNG